MPPSMRAALWHLKLLRRRVIAAAPVLFGRHWSLWEREEHRGRLLQSVRRPPWLGATASSPSAREFFFFFRRREIYGQRQLLLRRVFSSLSPFFFLSFASPFFSVSPANRPILVSISSFRSEKDHKHLSVRELRHRERDSGRFPVVETTGQSSRSFSKSRF